MAHCNDKVLEFSVFLIHKLARHLGKTTPEIYRLLSQNDILDGYIIECYDVLHTLGEQYLVNDISELLEERGLIA